MARPVAEFNTTTKTARQRLKPRPKPYYRGIGNAKSLGYIRREAGPGAWIVRVWSAGKYRTRVIGAADDAAQADGRDVLTFDQALRAATAPTLPPPSRSSLTVRAALEQYLKVFASRSSHGKEAKQRAEKHIFPKLGDHRVNRLTKKQIEDWQAGLIANADPNDVAAQRRSRDSANRILTILRAGLNAAFSDDENNITSDSAWRRVKPYKAVAGSRKDHFDAAQVRLLISKAAETDQAFANLIEAGFLTGARLGELVAADVKDFDAERALISIHQGKTGAREVTITNEAVQFFKRITKDRARTDVLLPRADGKRWGKSEQARPFKRALLAAELPASASFYSMRHSHASRAIESGMPLSLLAENLGTSLMMLQKNYAHVLASNRRESVEKTAPALRIVVEMNPDDAQTEIAAHVDDLSRRLGEVVK